MIQFKKELISDTKSQLRYGKRKLFKTTIQPLWSYFYNLWIWRDNETVQESRTPDIWKAISTKRNWFLASLWFSVCLAMMPRSDAKLIKLLFMKVALSLFLSLLYIYIYIHTHTHTHTFIYSLPCSRKRGSPSDIESNLKKNHFLISFECINHV